jgi:NAD(P)-dependent dehydrogenase (short-subunit alcohol dehydrogenase family)
MATTNNTLDGRVVLITGAASGIGAATALEVYAKGGIPVLLDCDAEPLAQMAQRCGPHALYWVADVTELQAMQDAVEKTLAELGRIDIVFANAGVAEARVTKLLVSREDAFLQIVPRLFRLLASKQVKPNWYTLSELIQKNDAQGQAQKEVEALRLRIAGDYFSAVARAN